MVTAHKETTIHKIISLLKEHGISQIPVVDKNKLYSIVAKIDLLNHLLGSHNSPDAPVKPLIETDYATVTTLTKIRLLKTIFNETKMVCVLDRNLTENQGEPNSLIGVITKIDLIDYLASK